MSSMKEGRSTDITESTQSVSILDLPFVPLIKILTYLGIHDLRNCALTCKSFNSLVREPMLWSDLYPIYWSIGNIGDDSSQALHNVSCKTEPNLGNRQWQVGINMNLKTLWNIPEYHMLSGMLEHLLPTVGNGVRVLNLNNSRCLDNTLLRALLVRCPNLTSLSIRSTIVSSEAFSRLSVYGACRQLRHLDLSLTQVNSTTLTSLVECWNDADEDELETMEIWMKENPALVFYINGDDYCSKGNQSGIWSRVQQFNSARENLSEDQIKTIPFPKKSSRKHGKFPGLKTLNLSGCPLNDTALSVLRNSPTLVENLEWLDVSGCLHLTPEAISAFVLSCPRLLPENLFYCSYITNGPYSKETNGCSQMSSQHCCDLYSY